MTQCIYIDEQLLRDLISGAWGQSFTADAAMGQIMEDVKNGIEIRVVSPQGLRCIALLAGDLYW